MTEVGVDLSDNLEATVQSNPVLEGIAISGCFDSIEYLISRDYITRWDEMVDLYDRNIFHIAAEHDRGDVIQQIVVHILSQNHVSSNRTLGFY